jgi:diacylglycerol kinase family enzyme
VTARARVVIQKSLAAAHEVTTAETSRRGHATRLAQGAAATGTEVVVVLGGDGTLSEAANGLAGSSCALGVLPGGSTNVFARTIGMTNDPIEATGELLGALGPGPGGIRSVSVGNVNGRHFLFHVGVGFDAAVVARVERRDTLKRLLGQGFFAYAAVDTWARHYDRRRPHFAIDLARRNGQSVTVEDGYFAICLKTDPYTFLGERPFNVAPGTDLDSALSVAVVRSLSAFNLLGLAAVALRGGEGFGRRRKATLVTDVVRASIRPYAPVPYQVDGDYLGDTTHLDFRWEPEHLRLVVPGR